MRKKQAIANGVDPEKMGQKTKNEGSQNNSAMANKPKKMRIRKTGPQKARKIRIQKRENPKNQRKTSWTPKSLAKPPHKTG